LACSIPVFRYALERWPPDPYQAVVLHRGELTDSQKELAKELATAAERWHVNLAAHTVDLAASSEERWTKLWEEAGRPTLPSLLLLYPGITGSAWAGPLTEKSVTALHQSPARGELIDRLVAGQSAVWVLLESGNQSKDDAAAAFLEKRLAHLTNTLELPTLAAEDIEGGLLSIPEKELKITFSLLRISRTNALEDVFVSMLLGSEDDLRQLQEPMVFPVFGRGRALYAIVGAGINEETVDEAGAFLTGSCSCQVKEQNPGVDLLLASDWDHRVKRSYAAEREIPPLVGLSDFAGSNDPPTNNAAPAARQTPPSPPSPEPAAPPSPAPLPQTAPPGPPAPSAPSSTLIAQEHGTRFVLHRTLMVVAAAGVLAAISFTVVLLRDRRSR
jgi:hypothetical protein